MHVLSACMGVGMWFRILLGVLLCVCMFVDLVAERVLRKCCFMYVCLCLYSHCTCVGC